MTLRVPILAAVIGEARLGRRSWDRRGRSCHDSGERILFQSLVPKPVPQSCGKDRRHAAEAAEALKLTAQDLMRL